MVITWVLWKRFELCKNLNYSLWSQLSNEYKNMGLRITPCDPTVILRKSAKILRKFSNGHNFVFFCKLFELCKSLKYSSWSQLSNEYKNMGLRIIPCDPTVILMENYMVEVWSVGQNVIWNVLPEQKLPDMVQWAWGNQGLVH